MLANMFRPKDVNKKETSWHQLNVEEHFKKRGLQLNDKILRAPDTFANQAIVINVGTSFPICIPFKDSTNQNPLSWERITNVNDIIHHFLFLVEQRSDGNIIYYGLQPSLNVRTYLSGKEELPTLQFSPLEDIGQTASLSSSLIFFVWNVKALTQGLVEEVKSFNGAEGDATTFEKIIERLLAPNIIVHDDQKCFGGSFYKSSVIRTIFTRIYHQIEVLRVKTQPHMRQFLVLFNDAMEKSVQQERADLRKLEAIHQVLSLQEELSKSLLQIETGLQSLSSTLQQKEKKDQDQSSELQLLKQLQSERDAEQDKKLSECQQLLTEIQNQSTNLNSVIQQTIQRSSNVSKIVQSVQENHASLETNLKVFEQTLKVTQKHINDLNVAKLGSIVIVYAIVYVKYFANFK